MRFPQNSGHWLKHRGVFALLGALLLSVTLAGPVFAQLGHAVPGQIGFQDSATPIMDEIRTFYNGILTPIIFAVSIFVGALLLIVVFRFNEKANPTPSTLTHNTALEVAWTIVPVLILVFIAIPSFRLLDHELVIPKTDMTIKVTGHQWYWSYAYPAEGFDFDSYIKADKDLKPGDLRQLSVDNEAVVPVNKTILVQVTATDVIHSFTVPSFGARIDAVPGRLNQTWFRATKLGLYYGQCSKLCGEDHAYMPIAFRVVSDADYAAWVVDAKKKFSANALPHYAEAAPAVARN
ncbi:MAG: cytochrome c oxidase subunit II [Pseudomonadota bacterium]